MVHKGVGVKNVHTHSTWFMDDLFKKHMLLGVGRQTTKLLGVTRPIYVIKRPSFYHNLGNQ